MRKLKLDCMESPALAPQTLAMPKKRRKTFIREWRKYRGISQEVLAEDAGMTAGNLSQLENGNISYTQDSLERLAAALDCDPVDLLTRDPKDGDEIYALAKGATPAQRKQIADLAKVLLKTDS
jgi:transcriptional regulator with XRE-family HTH domain